MAAALPEELEFELEALRATYGDEQVIIELPAGAAAGGGSGGGGGVAAAKVQLDVAPRASADHEQYVAGRLVMNVGQEYPAQAPGVQLADVKGLGDARLAELQAGLAAEATSLTGELQLGHLCETAIDLLTAANQPEGDCAFCLQPLLPAAGGGGDAAAAAAGQREQAVLRLGCYHCFHLPCFAPWWQWQQRRTAERERQVHAEYKSMAPLKLQEERIRREEGFTDPGARGSPGAAAGGSDKGHPHVAVEAPDGTGAGGGSAACSGTYVLACPACRADVLPSSLAHAWRQLQAAKAESWIGGSGASSRAALAELSPQQRQQLQAMQRRHAAVMRRQQECGGIVDASHAVSVSDLEQAAAAAAEAAAAAQAAAAPAGVPPSDGTGGRARGGRGRGQHSGRGPHGGPQPQHTQHEGPSAGEGGKTGGRQPGGRGAGRQGGGGRGRAAPVTGGEAVQAMEGLSLNSSTQQATWQQQHRPGSSRHGGRDGGGGRGSGRSGGRGRGGRGAPGSGAAPGGPAAGAQAGRAGPS